MRIDVGQPWSLAPLKGKYYGTEIIDRDGLVVMNVWRMPWTDKEGIEPSERELERWTSEFEASDSHYESVASYEIAQAIIEKINGNANSS